MLFKWWNLQLFADGGEGDGGSESGETAAAAGQRRLEELGVPKSRIRDRARNAVGQMQKAQAPAAQAAAVEDTPAEETTTETEKPQEKKPTLQELLKDPDYNQEMQNIFKARLKGQKEAQPILDQLAPALEVLARQYHLDPENLDYEALAKAVNDDDQFYEAMALAKGEDIQTLKARDQQSRQEARERTLQEQRYLEHFQKMEQQGEALKQTFPGFDLRTELQNPAFARMTHPSVGISVEDAYYAVHRAEINAASMQVTAQKTAEKISKAIASGQSRPAEAGQSSQAPSVSTFDYRAASREQREALKQRIRQAAARGEKVYPGQ